MPTGCGDPTGRGLNPGLPPQVGLHSQPLTFKEEAERCRAQAQVTSSREGALMLLRVASAFDDLHALTQARRPPANDASPR